MALKRATPPAIGAIAIPMSRRARRPPQNPGREPGGAASVRILVVVANKMRTLKAEEGKVPCERHLHMGSDLRRRGKPVRERVAARASKGNRVKILEPGRGGGRQR
ncbi:hornerin-like [Iris pallida]|uniref:Hornerin-like n=1 Tax=Iris pallida TaxID=29817 RepID=A0AAX6E1U1_IRIPA|nr:hornerin-like [Iris pallida]